MKQITRQPHPRRRKLLLLLGQALVTGPVAAQNFEPGFARINFPACVVTPQQTEGPYFVNEMLLRSDLRTDPSDGQVSAGMPLTLTLRILSAGGTRCLPVADAMVDIWHCDAAGVYSDANDRAFKTVGKKFLRGYQITNQNGEVRFLTIYPGWYPGRAIHMHVKVRLKTRNARNYEFNSQLYFDETINDQVLQHAAYRRPGRRVRNNQDGIFQDGGRSLVITPRKDADGYAAAFDIGLGIT